MLVLKFIAGARLSYCPPPSPVSPFTAAAESRDVTRSCVLLPSPCKQLCAATGLKSDWQQSRAQPSCCRVNGVGGTSDSGGACDPLLKYQ